MGDDAKDILKIKARKFKTPGTQVIRIQYDAYVDLMKLHEDSNVPVVDLATEFLEFAMARVKIIKTEEID